MALQAQFGAMVRALWTAPELARVCAALRVRAPAFTAAEARQLRDETRWFDPQESAADRLRLLFDYSVTVAHLVMLMARARKEVERARGPVAALDAVLVRPADGTRWDDGRSARAGPDPPDGANTLGGVGFAAAAAADRAAMDSDLLAFMRCCEYGITRCCAVRARMQTLDQTRVVQFAIPFGEWANAFVPGEPARFDMEVAQRGPLMYMQPIGGGNGGHGGPPARFLVRVDARGRPVFRLGAPLLTGQAGGVAIPRPKVRRQPVPQPIQVGEAVVDSGETYLNHIEPFVEQSAARKHTPADVATRLKELAEKARVSKNASKTLERRARVAEAEAQTLRRQLETVAQTDKTKVDRQQLEAAQRDASQKVATAEEAAERARNELARVRDEARREVEAEKESLRRMMPDFVKQFQDAVERNKQQIAAANGQTEEAQKALAEKEAKLSELTEYAKQTEQAYEKLDNELKEAKTQLRQLKLKIPDEDYEAQVEELQKLKEEHDVAKQAASQAAFLASREWAQDLAVRAIAESEVNDAIKRAVADKLNSAFDSLNSPTEGWQDKLRAITEVAARSNRDAIFKTLANSKGQGRSTWTALRTAIDSTASQVEHKTDDSAHRIEEVHVEEVDDQAALDDLKATVDAIANQSIDVTFPANPEIGAPTGGGHADAKLPSAESSVVSTVASAGMLASLGHKLTSAAQAGARNFAHNTQRLVGMALRNPLLTKAAITAGAGWLGLTPEVQTALTSMFGGESDAQYVVNNPVEFANDLAVCMSSGVCTDAALRLTPEQRLATLRDSFGGHHADVVKMQVADATVEFVPRSELLLALSTLPPTNPLAYCKDLARAYQGSGMGAACRDEYQRLCVEYAARRETK